MKTITMKTTKSSVKTDKLTKIYNNIEKNVFDKNNIRKFLFEPDRMS